MFRTLALAVLAGAVAAPALAATQVTIDVAKLDAPAVHKAILRAARDTCESDFGDTSALVRYYVQPECIRHTVATAEAKYAAMRGLASR
jgi:hypothetical protein